MVNGYLHARDVWLEDADRWVGDWLPTAQAQAHGGEELSVEITIAGTKLLCMFSGTFMPQEAGAQAVALNLCIDDEPMLTAKEIRIYSWMERIAFQWIETDLPKGKHTVKVQWRQVEPISGKVKEMGCRVLSVVGL